MCVGYGCTIVMPHPRPPLPKYSPFAGIYIYIHSCICICIYIYVYVCIYVWGVGVLL